MRDVVSISTSCVHHRQAQSYVHKSAYRAAVCIRCWDGSGIAFVETILVATEGRWFVQSMVRSSQVFQFALWLEKKVRNCTFQHTPVALQW